MQRRFNLFRTLILVILTLQVSATPALPSDTHLNLCLGYDGHFEISADACHVLSDLPSQPPTAFQTNEDHHGDCLDLPIGCSDSKSLFPSAANLQLLRHQSPGNNSSSAMGGYLSVEARQLSNSLNRSLTTPAVRFSPPAHLAPLRTIILLI